jgi:hypothetical protein
MRWEGVDWCHPGLDRKQCLAVVNAETNLPSFIKVAEFVDQKNYV